MKKSEKKKTSRLPVQLLHAPPKQVVAPKGDDIIDELSGGSDFEDDHYRDALDAAESSPEPLGSAVRAHQAKRDAFNGWTDDWEWKHGVDDAVLDMLYGPVIPYEARVTGALRAFARRLVPASAVIAEMALCQQAYAKLMARKNLRRRSR